MPSSAGTMLAIVFGMAEGAVFASSAAVAPVFFREQMRFESFAIMKLFLSGVGASMVAQAVLSVAAPRYFDQSRFYTNRYIPLTRALPGCFVLGAGMYVGAVGPTMIGAQLAIGIADTWYGLLGALCGGAVYGLAEEHFLSTPITQVRWRGPSRGTNIQW